MNDLISRKAVLDIFKPWLDVKGYSEGELNMLRAVIYELETMSSTSAWISVKDRLPESDGFYLAWYTFKDSGHACDIFYYNCGSPISSTITHWMPLPEPPSGCPDYWERRGR